VVGGLLSAVLIAGLLVSPVLCWGSAAHTTSSPAADLTPVPRVLREDTSRVPPARVVDVAAVVAAVEAAAASASASVDAVVLDARGRTLVQTSGADRPVLSASLVKLFVVQQLLARAGPAGWDATTLGRMERAVTVSDDAAMNELWTAYEGPALVRDAVAAFGLTGTAPPAVPGQWGQATTTARDVARFLSAQTGVPAAEEAAALLLDWMRAAAPTAADGFDQMFGLRPGSGAAVKQGWMCCVDGRRQLHTAGVLADGRVVVLLAEAGVSTTWGETAAAVDGATAVLLSATR
jgi:hypothetical protein